MTNTVSGVDYMSAPKDYAELFQVYYAYVVNLVRQAGIDDSRKEDVASEILARFLERDFLAKFDPTLTFIYEGEERPARFKSFLSRFVLTYARGYYDKQQRLKMREALICDMPITSSSRGGFPTSWLEVYGPAISSSDEDVLDIMDADETINALRRYLYTIPRRSRYDTCDLVALFDAVIAQIQEFGEPNIAELKDQFSVSTTAMHTWMWWLKECLCKATGRPLPPKRPRTPRPAFGVAEA